METPNNHQPSLAGTAPSITVSSVDDSDSNATQERPILPSGWIAKHFYGSILYIHTASSKVQWNPPGTIPTEENSGPTPILPKGWISQPFFGRTLFVNTKTGEKSFTLPKKHSIIQNNDDFGFVMLEETVNVETAVTVPLKNPPQPQILFLFQVYFAIVPFRVLSPVRMALFKNGQVCFYPFDETKDGIPAAWTRTLLTKSIIDSKLVSETFLSNYTVPNTRTAFRSIIIPRFWSSNQSVIEIRKDLRLLVSLNFRTRTQMERAMLIWDRHHRYLGSFIEK